VSGKCFQLYYTCSDRLLTIALPSCSFHLFPPLTVTFPKLLSYFACTIKWRPCLLRRCVMQAVCRRCLLPPPETSVSTGNLRRISGPKRDEVTGEWRKLHSEELHNLYSSPDIIRQVKSRRMRWEGHVSRMGGERKVYKVLVGKPEGRRPLGRPRRRWEDGVRMDLKEIGLGGCGLDSTGSGQGPVAGCCECGDEPSGSCATELVS
jgi:hypothetical protein